MSPQVSFRGEPVDSREIELTMSMTNEAITETMRDWCATDDNPGRTVTISLAPGQTWMSVGPRLRRGQLVKFAIMGIPFDGRVLFRRRERLVLVGRFETDARPTADDIEAMIAYGETTDES